MNFGDIEKDTIRFWATNPSSPIIFHEPIVNPKVQDIVSRATQSVFRTKTDSLFKNTSIEEINNPSNKYLNRFKLCIKDFKILKDTESKRFI